MNFSILTQPILLFWILLGSLNGLTNDDLWQQWKLKFKKVYPLDEEQLRRQKWEQTVSEITEHNIKHDLGLVTYTMGLNQFSDLGWEELKSIYSMDNLTLQLRKIRDPIITQYTDDNSTTMVVPAEKDWRNCGYVSPIEEQGKCGSCWSFAVVGMIEGQYKKMTKNLIVFSKQEMVDCGASYRLKGCNGGSPYDAALYIIDMGLTSARNYPYIGRVGQCRNKQTPRLVMGRKFVLLNEGDEDQLIKSIASIGPVMIAIHALQDFGRYKSGIYSSKHCPKTGNHAMLAVGYGSEKGKDYYIIKNSWGKHWGEKGYCKIARNRDNMCGIANDASYLEIRMPQSKQ